MRWLLAAVFLLGFLLRLVFIDKLPVGFTPDEASFGYDAYSILKTGRDQWGTVAPLVLKSFGDYKSPLYSYLAIPSVMLFGLDKVAVRLPNAILGCLAIVVVYLLASKLTNRKIGLMSGLLLTISPWHIMMSRGAFEANLITFFLPLGIYLFLEKKYNLSVIIFGLSLFTYHSAKLITPLVFIALLLIYRFKKIVPVVIFGVFFALMLYSQSLGGAKRIQERSIMVGALEEGAKIKIELIQNGMNPILARILHNKYQVGVKRFVNNYTQYFSNRFLFKDGPAETTYGMVPGVGVIYLFEGLLFLGLIFAWKDKNLKVAIIFLLFWLLISPVPAALSTGVGYAANRAVAMIPSIQILAAIGAYGITEFLKRYDKRFLSAFVVIVAFLAATGVSNAYKRYFVESPNTSAKGMLAGNLEVARELVANSDKYDQVIVPRSWSEPHIYIAFAGKMDPKIYQAETKGWGFEKSGVDWVDQIPQYSLGKFTFR